MSKMHQGVKSQELCRCLFLLLLPTLLSASAVVSRCCSDAVACSYHSESMSGFRIGPAGVSGDRVLTKHDFRARLRFSNRARQTTSEFGKLAVFENRDVQFGRCRFRNRSYQRALRPLFININNQT